ncbi:MAG: sigma-70 family RNA polymerase sigma factor [Planctomycetota bacterium]|nr:MAG: sigma-70 family RNA polymerase sigma factor [Planctomycetota bacterium]
MAGDTQLVREFQSGDRDAFAKLVERYQNYVCSLAYSATGDVSRSEDIAQQAFLVAWQNRTKLRDPRRWTGWLRGLVQNIARNLNRRQQIEDDYRRHLTEQTDAIDRNNPLDHCLRRERAEIVWSVLGDLPTAYREPLILYYREGKSVAAVAELMSLSPDAVKQRLARGRKMVKQEVASLIEETLEETRPESSFTANVLTAISSGTLAQTSVKAIGGAWLGAINPLHWLAVALGPLIGVAGGVFGSKVALDAAESPQERTWIWRSTIASIALVAGMLAVQGATIAFWPELFRQVVTQVILWTVYSILLVVVIVYFNHHISQARRASTPADGTNSDSDPHADQRTAPSAVSIRMLRWNSIGTMAGPLVAPVLAAAMSYDWIGLAVLLLAATALVGWTWSRAPRYATARRQLVLNAQSVMLMTTVLTASLLLRWDYWIARLPPQYHHHIPGWVIALPVFLFGSLIAARLISWSRRMDDDHGSH